MGSLDDHAELGEMLSDLDRSLTAAQAELQEVRGRVEVC